MIIGNPLVSIIACCYNHERFLLETLNSIKSQTYVNIELIVIDDFSTGKTENLNQNSFTWEADLATIDVKKILNDNKITTIMVSHNTSEVKNLSDRIFNLENGALKEL